VLVLQVESILDEATAELGKMEFSPVLGTIDFSIKIKKRVPLHTSLLIKCEVGNLRSFEIPATVFSSQLRSLEVD
jgi:hypothetical protein